MGYQEFYLSRKVVGNSGFGRKMWMLRTPRRGDNPAGDSLLGSLVKEVNVFWPLWGGDYPEPYHLTTPQLFLTALQSRKNDLGIPTNVEIIKTKDLVNTSFTLNKSTGLELGVAANVVPAIPMNLSLGMDLSNTQSVKFSLGAGARIKYIPTDYLARLARHLEGDPRRIDPSVAVEIDDNLIVNKILLAKSYRVDFTLSSTLAPFFEAEAEVANAKFGGKLKIGKKAEYSFTIEITEDMEHLIGFKTIDWDDICDEPYAPSS